MKRIEPKAQKLWGPGPWGQAALGHIGYAAQRPLSSVALMLSGPNSKQGSTKMQGTSMASPCPMQLGAVPSCVVMCYRHSPGMVCGPWGLKAEWR